jgi:chromosome segregation ATPase
MAKQNQQIRERVRHLTIRLDDQEHALAQARAALAKNENRLDQLVLTIANIIKIDKPDDLEELFADVVQRFEPYPEPVGPATHLEAEMSNTGTGSSNLEAVVSNLTKGLEPAKHHSTRNTPEKKAMRKDWCLRLSAIRTECNISVEALTDHRPGKCKTRNWENIERAAGLEVYNNNNKQDFPRHGTIASYVKRLHLIVITAAHKAAMAASPVSSIRFDNFDERFYNSRADLLLEIYREIEASNPNVRVNNYI